jgi:hypothetical protein
LKRTFIPLGFCALLALVLTACGGSDNTSNATTTNATTTNKATTTTTTTTTTNSPATTSTTPASTTTASSSGNKIGIPECDDFLAKYEACISGKVPEAARAQYKTTIEQWRKSWRDLAANPQTKPTLVQACKTSADSAKESMKMFGCSF